MRQDEVRCDKIRKDFALRVRVRVRGLDPLQDALDPL